MKTIDIYEDFYFNGKKLSQMGGRIIGDGMNTLTSVLPIKEVYTGKVLGVDGEIPYGAKLNPRTFDLTIYFDSVTDIRTISAWLHTNEPVDFYYVGDTIKSKVMLSDMVDMDMYYGGILDRHNFKGIMSLKFICYDPYYYLITDKIYTYTTFSSTHTFVNDGNVNSFARIKFEVTGIKDISYKLNGIQTTLKGVNTYCYLDAMYKTVEDSQGNKRYILSGEYPILKPQNNTFQLVSGSVNKITIECRSRFI